MWPASLRKSLLIITVLFAAITVPSTVADTITDPSTTTTFKFQCCNGLNTKVFDLQVTTDLPTSSNPIFGITPLDPTCSESVQNPFTATYTCGDGISTVDTIIETVTVNGAFLPKVLIATWSDKNGNIIGSTTPIPEPAGIFLVGNGIALLAVLQLIGRRRRESPENVLF